MSRGIEKFMVNTCPKFNPEMRRRLVYALRKLRLTQGEFAAKLGVSQGTISKIVSGRTERAEFTTGRFRAALGIHFNFVFTGEGCWNYPGYRPLKTDGVNEDDL